MQDNQIIQKNNNLIKKDGNNGSNGQELKSYFDLIHKLDKNDEILEPRCKFCKHELRHEAEEVWERVKRFNPVMEFFHKSGSTDMTIKNVRRHIRNHYLRQEQVIRRRHYADRLLPTINYKIDKLKRIETFLAVLEDKMWKYASIEHEEPLQDIRNSDMVIKISKEVTNLLKLQAEIEGDLKPVEVVVERFQQIIVNTMNKIDDPKIRMEMGKELEALRDVSIINV